MTKEDIEQLWQKDLNNFLKTYREKVKDMTQEEERKYVKEHKVEEKLHQLQKKYKKMYDDTQN